MHFIKKLLLFQEKLMFRQLLLIQKIFNEGLKLLPRFFLWQNINSIHYFFAVFKFCYHIQIFIKSFYDCILFHLYFAFSMFLGCKICYRCLNVTDYCLLKFKTIIEYFFIIIFLFFIPFIFYLSLLNLWSCIISLVFMKIVEYDYFDVVWFFKLSLTFFSYCRGIK